MLHTYLKKNGTPFLDLFLDQPLGKAEKRKAHNGYTCYVCVYTNVLKKEKKN